MDSQNITILQQQLFNLPIGGEIGELFRKLDDDIKSIIQSSIEQKNNLKDKKNKIEAELSNYDHLMFLSETNHNKNENQNILDVAKALINLQYLAHKTLREIDMEIASLKCDIEIMEHDLELYRNNRIHNKYDFKDSDIELFTD